MELGELIMLASSDRKFHLWKWRTRVERWSAQASGITTHGETAEEAMRKLVRMMQGFNIAFTRAVTEV